MKWIGQLSFSFLLVCLCQIANGQLPTTNIYTLDLRANEQKVLLNNLTLLTAFNIDGYNNQPHFVGQDELLITSDYMSLGLTDILMLHLRDNKITRITKTEESEYSPTVMADGIGFSVVRQEMTDSETIPQVLWSYPLNRENQGKQIIPDLDKIGYHSWVTADKVALFIVSEPSELVIYDTRINTTTHVAYNVGRCLKVGKDNSLYYIQDIQGMRSIRSYDVYLGRSKKIGAPITSQIDFDLLPNGHLLAAEENRLMTLIPGIDTEWKLIMDLAGSGIKNISRISSTRDKIAIVTQ